MLTIVAEKLLCCPTHPIFTLCGSIVAINIVYTGGGWHSWEEFAELSHTCNGALWMESKTTAVQSLVGCLSRCVSDYCSSHG